MKLEDRVKELEQRVAILERRRSSGKSGRPLLGDKERKIEQAKSWIVGYLRGKRARVHGSDLSKLPRGAELVHILLDDGRQAGFSETLLRSARIVLDGQVEACHVPGSQSWMWRLT